LAEGTRALGATVLAAALAAVTVYLFTATRREGTTSNPWAIPVAFALLLGGAAVFTIIDQQSRSSEASWLALLAVLTVLIGVLALTAMARWNGARGLAGVTAAAIIAWGTAYVFITERAGSNPSFEPVQFVRKDESGSQGLLLAYASSELSVICVGEVEAVPQPDGTVKRETWRSVLTVPRDDIQQVSFQPAVPINDYEIEVNRAKGRRRDCRLLRGASLAPPTSSPVPTATREPAPTVTAAPTPTATASPPVQPSPSATATAKPKPTVSATATATTAPPKSPPPVPVDTRGPRIPRHQPRSARLDSEHRFLYPLGTFKEDVTGVVSFVTVARVPAPSGHGSPVRVATNSFEARGNGTAAVRPGVSSFVRRLLRDQHHLDLTVTIVALDERGNARRRTTSLVLRPERHGH
jgi:hypothetical protein